jgi:hypothetical protein
MDPYRAPQDAPPSVPPRASWEIPANDGHLVVGVMLIGAACVAILTAAFALALLLH